MAIKQLKAGTAIALAAAGKMALSNGTASAEESGGKLPAAEQEAPPLHLDIVGTPRDIVLPPTFEFREDYADFEPVPTDGGGKLEGTCDPMLDPSCSDPMLRAETTGTGSKMPDEEGAPPDEKMEVFDQDGFIFVGDIKRYMMENKKPKIDFIVSGVKNAPTDVYLVYSAGKEADVMDDPSKVKWDAFGSLMAGGMEVDFSRMHIVAGVRVQPTQVLPVEQLNAAVMSMGGEPQPAMGTTLAKNRTVVVSVALEDLVNLPDVVYFQALAVPMDSLDFANGQASEMDRFVIAKPDMDPADGTDPMQGSKAGESGKAAETTTPSGEPTGDPTGTDTGTGTKI